MHRPDAFGERFEQRLAPAGRRVGHGLLIGLLIGLGEEGHHLVVLGRDEFLHGNAELDIVLALFFGNRKKVQLRQLLGGVVLGKNPFHGLILWLVQNSTPDQPSRRRARRSIPSCWHFL